ncbi:MAG: lycopene cyclase domain-containing protein, partial [Halodesulfurarchaeum sp.]
LMVVVSVAYTVPWETHLIAHGVWSYGDDTVMARLFGVPLEEYLFIVLEVLLAGLWLASLPRPDPEPPTMDLGDRGFGLVAGLVVGAAGISWTRFADAYYIGWLLTWAAPVLAVQWAYGWPYLWRARKLIATAVLGPTLYLSITDRIAIELGIWSLSETYTVGWTILGLPVEEATFFLLTSLFLVQGIVLFDWLLCKRGWSEPA